MWWDDQRHREWLAEQRYRAVLEVLIGATVTEAVVRYGVSRQSIYVWKRSAPRVVPPPCRRRPADRISVRPVCRAKSGP